MKIVTAGAIEDWVRWVDCQYLNIEFGQGCGRRILYKFIVWKTG